MSNPLNPTILIAGDVCLDVVGISMPKPSSATGPADNWRLTGETRTHYLLGGALLLTEFVRAALPGSNIRGPCPCLPTALSCGQATDQPLTPEAFLTITERLTREEIVHSLLALDVFRSTPDAKDAATIRVRETHGFSGPKQGDPNLKIVPPGDSEKVAGLVVLDDTGNGNLPLRVVAAAPPGQSVRETEPHARDGEPSARRQRRLDRRKETLHQRRADEEKRLAWRTRFPGAFRAFQPFFLRAFNDPPVRYRPAHELPASSDYHRRTLARTPCAK